MVPAYARQPQVGCESGLGPCISMGKGLAALPQISESRCLFNHGLFYGSGFRRRSLPLSFTDPVRAAAQAGNGEGSNHYNQHSAHQAILSPGAEQPIESPQIKRYAAPPS
jgi:hypothetical protein